MDEESDDPMTRVAIQFIIQTRTILRVKGGTRSNGIIF